MVMLRGRVSDLAPARPAVSCLLAALGVARSELYPTLAAIAISHIQRAAVLLGTDFFRQTIQTFEGSLDLSYTIFVFGARRGRIDAARAQRQTVRLWIGVFDGVKCTNMASLSFQDIGLRPTLVRQVERKAKRQGQQVALA